MTTVNHGRMCAGATALALTVSYGRVGLVFVSWFVRVAVFQFFARSWTKASDLHAEVQCLARQVVKLNRG